MRQGYDKSKGLRGRSDDSIGRYTRAERQDMWTSLPGEVVDFDPQTQTATIKPHYKSKFNGEVVEMPELQEVPMLTQRNGAFALTFPIKKGDGVMLNFQARDSELWYNKGGPQEGFSARMHNLSDAVFIPGLEASPKVLPNYNADSAEFRTEDGKTKVELTPDNKIRLESLGEELLRILDDFMAVMQDHTNEGLEHDQAGQVAAIRDRLSKLLA